MTFRPQYLQDAPLLLEEILPGSVLELDEPGARAGQDIHVRVTVQRDEESVIVTGAVRTVLQLQCGRCADWMDWPIRLDNFVLLLEPPWAEVVDLTQFIREDILLDLPVVAACRLDKEDRCPMSGRVYPQAGQPAPLVSDGEVWKDLDKIKVKD